MVADHCILRNKTNKILCEDATVVEFQVMELKSGREFLN